MNILLLLSLFSQCYCGPTLQLPSDSKRSERGKDTLNRLKTNQRNLHSPCWTEALSNFDTGCRGMTDMEQSYLALQFSNCHLKKSSLKQYPCLLSNFQECTREMANDIIAFQTYTEFFTHVSDICFYLQSSIWQESTEDTINKLSKASTESLNTLSQAVLQQNQVLKSQKESLENQQSILENEKLLKETLLSSAQSAKDIFEEVREHAQQQKTMFSETFDTIFESVDRLVNLQTMLLGEFIGLQSIAFYLIAVVICYLFTSTPRTSSARLPLFVTLSFLIVAERVYVGWMVEEVSKEEGNNEIMHSKIWTIRKMFFFIATVILSFFASRYKDFNQINHTILQELQHQVGVLRELQERSETKNKEDFSGDETIVAEKLDIATKQLEETLQNFVTSTPHKKNLELNSQETLKCNVEDGKRKKSLGRKKRTQLQSLSVNASLNDSGYNLRSRNKSSDFSTLNNSEGTTVKAKVHKTKPKEKKTSSKKPAFFSSDEEL